MSFQKGFSLLSPFFFFVVDSWLLSAGAAGVVVAAGCAALESVGVAAGVLPALESVESVVVAAGAASVDPVVAGAIELADPGVTVSTVAELPVAPGAPVMPNVGGVPKFSVSSPDSLAGVIVGAPVCADAETSGPVFSAMIDLRSIPGRSWAASCSFCILATAEGSGWGTGIPNLVSLALASPAIEESG